MDQKWIHLIRNKPLLPDGHRIRLRVINGPQRITIRCKTYFYDPVFEILKLQTTHSHGMCAYFRLLGSINEPLVIKPIQGVKLIHLRWVALSNDGFNGNLKTKLYFTPQYDQAEEDLRRAARAGMSEQNYLDLVDKFDRVTKKSVRLGTKPKIKEIVITANHQVKPQTTDKHKSLPFKMSVEEVTPRVIEFKVNESRPGTPDSDLL